MSIRNFVSGSSVILAGWLTVTFLYEVPSKSYPRLGKLTTQTVQVRIKDKAEPTLDAKKEFGVVSLSH
jgi:hypothetical protein